MIPRSTLLAALLVLAPAAFRPAVADDVYLVNGEVFEEVVAEAGEAVVRIRMAGGEMRLPRSMVERIEESATPYAEYLQRRRRLEEAGAAAGDWLELAEWAYRRGLRASARAAARTAADLDPDLEGLSSMMHRFGFVRAAETGRWIPGRRSPHRRPTANPEPPPPPVPDPVEEVARRRIREALAEGRRQALAEAALAEAGRRDAPSATAVAVSAPVVYSVPLPFVVIRGDTTAPRPPAPPPPSRGGGPALNLFERQPGSLIPGTLVLDPR